MVNFVRIKTVKEFKKFLRQDKVFVKFRDSDGYYKFDNCMQSISLLESFYRPLIQIESLKIEEVCRMIFDNEKICILNHDGVLRRYTPDMNQKMIEFKIEYEKHSFFSEEEAIEADLI